MRLMKGSRHRPRLERVLELVEAVFKLELLPRLLAGLEQQCAFSVGLFAPDLCLAHGARVGEGFPWARLLPEAFARQETVFEAGADHLLYVVVAKRIGHCGA